MTTLRARQDLDALNFTKGGGLVTVVAQDARSREVLMVAHADREALERTLATGEMHYRSRSRGLWHKGETSGNVQRVIALHFDCDADAVLALIEPGGPACHTGDRSCFGDAATAPIMETLDRLDTTIQARAADDSDAHANSYTRRLLGDRNLRLKKLGEEAVELAVACADGSAERAASEAADLLYHMLVALRAVGVGLNEVRMVLEQRAR